MPPTGAGTGHSLPHRPPPLCLLCLARPAQRPQAPRLATSVAGVARVEAALVRCWCFRVSLQLLTRETLVVPSRRIVRVTGRCPIGGCFSLLVALQPHSALPLPIQAFTLSRQRLPSGHCQRCSRGPSIAGPMQSRWPRRLRHASRVTRLTGIMYPKEVAHDVQQPDPPATGATADPHP